MAITLGITMGDVNGVGPEILAKVLSRTSSDDTQTLVVYGSPEALSETARQCSLPPEWFESVEFRTAGVTDLRYEPGAMRAEAGAAAMRWLEAAIDDVTTGTIDAIVTCPISKEGIRAAGYACTGHTDYIAERTGSPNYRMSLFAGPMRAVHVSGHMPLKQALQSLTSDGIATTIRLAHDALERLGTPMKRIAVAGLNPHAGENGLLGSEDEAIVRPAVELCHEEGIDCSGPYPPDTVFWRMQRGDFDFVVALYHDQGHIPMKLVAMDIGVNVTLGIPIVRTSVDHGTAYDIAGKNVASESSLREAIALAARFAARA
jgi:4-hydroxythreonine-4-phosphate dehydrogenase